jgi:hypothetical protein
MGIKTTQNPKPIRNLSIKMQKFANKKLQAKEVCKIEVWPPLHHQPVRVFGKQPLLGTLFQIISTDPKSAQISAFF